MKTTLKFKLRTIGMALSPQFPKSSCRVLGLDIDPAKIIETETGRSYVRQIPAEDVGALALLAIGKTGVSNFNSELCCSPDISVA